MSTASIQQIRTETMYILSLDAGLLTDKAYEYLKDKTNQFQNPDGETS